MDHVGSPSPLTDPYDRDFNNRMVDRRGYTYTPDSEHEANLYRAAHGAWFPDREDPPPDRDPLPVSAPEPKAQLIRLNVHVAPASAPLPPQSFWRGWWIA